MVDREQLGERARAVLKANDLGGWTKPAPGLYPHQWNWDSCFIAIGISHYDFVRAATEIRSLLRGQWKNGMVPQIVFNPAESGYFPGPDVWQSQRSPNAPSDVETSGITQPPVLAIAVWEIYRNAADKVRAKDFLAEVYPRILAYHRWLYTERNPDGNGLITVIHPWESGLDNSPPYLDAGSRVHLTYKPQYQRLDLLHVSAKNRPTNKDYDLYVYLLEQMRAVDWNQRPYLETAPLQVEDVLFNSILCRANDALSSIADVLGESSDEMSRWNDLTKTAINDKLWDDVDQTYYDFDRIAGTLLRDDTIAGLHALYGGVASLTRADALIDQHLLKPEQYLPESGFPVPTTSMASRWFNPQNYWLGPVWVNTNWMVLHGLLRYKRNELASDIRRSTLDLIEKNGFREYFNPLSGDGYGTDSFGWSAALTIDLLVRPTA